MPSLSKNSAGNFGPPRSVLRAKTATFCRQALPGAGPAKASRFCRERTTWPRGSEAPAGRASPKAAACRPSASLNAMSGISWGSVWRDEFVYRALNVDGRSKASGFLAVRPGNNTAAADSRRKGKNSQSRIFCRFAKKKRRFRLFPVQFTAAILLNAWFAPSRTHKRTRL